jgi:hypothetical protein
MHSIPRDILPFRLLARRKFLLLNPLSIGYFGTVILPRSWKPLFLLQVLVIETLHFGSKTCQRLYDRNPELV